jgi:hypothetical protein
VYDLFLLLYTLMFCRFLLFYNLEDTLLWGTQLISFEVLGLIHSQCSLDLSYFRYCWYENNCMAEWKCMCFFFPGRGAVGCHINFWLLSQSVGFMSLASYLQHTVIPLQHLVSFGLNLVSRAFEFQVLSPPPPFVCISKSWSHLM